MISKDSVEEKIVKLQNDKELKPLNKFTDDYSKEVISVRNQFAHVKEQVGEDGKMKLISHQTGQEEVFNSERCIEIRKTLIGYNEKLNLLETKLG